MKERKATAELLKQALHYMGFNIDIRVSGIILSTVNLLNQIGDKFGFLEIAKIEREHDFEIQVKVQQNISTNKRNYYMYRYKK